MWNERDELRVSLGRTVRLIDGEEREGKVIYSSPDLFLVSSFLWYFVHVVCL